MAERQSAQMSKITNDGQARDALCSHMATVGERQRVNSVQLLRQSVTDEAKSSVSLDSDEWLFVVVDNRWSQHF